MLPTRPPCSEDQPRTKLAVPYRNAQTPSERSVWGQPGLPLEETRDSQMSGCTLTGTGWSAWHCSTAFARIACDASRVLALELHARGLPLSLPELESTPRYFHTWSIDALPPSPPPMQTPALHSQPSHTTIAG